MMKKVNSNLSKSHANNIIKISYSEEENQKSIKCNGFNLIELPLNEDNISMKGINNESNIVVEIKEPEKESLLNKEYQRLKDVSHKVQDYYLSIENDSIVKENCHKCLMTDFESNELLHFNTRKELLNYLKYCFVFEKKILFTNHQIYINNKYDLEKCDGSYLNGWRFFIPKTICKSCFMKIINMDKLFANLKTVICDVSPKRNKINNSCNSNHKNTNNSHNNNNEGKWNSNYNKKNENASNVKRIHAKKKYMRSKRIQRINNINNNNNNHKLNNIKNNYKNNNKNLMKNKKNNNKNNNNNNNNNKNNENILFIDENNNIIIDKKIFNDPLLKSIENYKNNNSNKNNNIKNIENIENNNNNNKYNSQLLFSHNQLRINNNNNNQNNYQSNNSIGNTTINNINIVNKFNNKIDGFSNNNNNNIISITNNSNINNYNQNDLSKFNNNQSILIPKIFSNKYYVFIYIKITDILNYIKELKENLKKYNSSFSNKTLFSNNLYILQNNKIIQFYNNIYKLIFDIYKKQNELKNFFNNFLDNISNLKSKIYSLYTQPMFQNYYQKICSMFDHLNKLEIENKKNFEYYQNLFSKFFNFSNQLLLIIKQEINLLRTN